MNIKQLFIAVALLAITPQAHPMMQNPIAATDVTAISQAPWMSFDDALIFKDNAEIMLNCFIEILRNWSTAAQAWERAESTAAAHEGKVTEFLDNVISILEGMLNIKNSGPNPGDFICVFDIDGTIFFRHPTDRTSIYEFLPTLMLYHAAVALGCQIHIISARHLPNVATRDSWDSPYTLTKNDLSNLGIEANTYTLHLNEGVNFATYPINERAAKMGLWKHEKRLALATANQVLFTIDDLSECLKGNEYCLGKGILVPVDALGAHYVAHKENKDAQICRLQGN